MQARGVPAVACCHVQHQAFATVSKAQVVQVSGLIDSILSSGPDGAAAAHQLQLHEAAANAIAGLALMDAPRVYV